MKGKKPKGKDYATGKPVDMSKPEETVRQDYEKVLHEDYGYSKKKMDIEVPIQRGSSSREKADIVIYKTADKKKREQNEDILGIVETKRNDRKDGIKQLTSYMTATSCSWGAWTNGKEIEYLCKNHKTGEVKRDVVYQIPKCGQELEDIESFAKKDLKPASNLKLVFRRMLNTLYANTNSISRREKLGNEMIRLLFCKIQDEQFNVEEPPKFCVRIRDEESNFELLGDRIRSLFHDVKKDLVVEGIFEESETITLDNKSIAYVVGELQMFSLTGTDEDSVGNAFEVFAESKFIGEKGEFFTPREVVKIAVQIVDPKPGELILDPACGSGGFLIFALEHIWTRMRTHRKWKGLSQSRFDKERKKIAERTIYGIDKELDLVKITKAYMAIIGDGKSRIVQQNSLHTAEEFEGPARQLFVAGNDSFNKFDVILTNPPFGSKNTKVVESESRHFDLGHKWKKQKDEYVKTKEAKKTPPQELFIERCLGLLKDKGRLAIVLPETYFHAPTKKYIIEYIKKGNNIKAVIDLPHNTFRPHCNAKTLLMILEKGVPQGDIIFGVAKEMGKDHLGKPKMRPKNGIVTTEIWDDTKHVREELPDPESPSNIYVFCVKSDQIKDNIYVPRYYWKEEDKNLEEQAKAEDFDLLPMETLVEEGIIEIYKGHGSPPNEYKGLGNVPYVRAGDIGNWSVYKNPVSAIPEHVYHEVKGANGVDLEAEDLIFVKEGSYRIGDVAIVLPTDTKILLNSHCFVVRVKQHDNKYEIDPYYLAYLISHRLTKQQLYSKTFIDTTLPNIGNRWRELLLPMTKDKETVSKIKQTMRKIVKRRTEAERMINTLMETKGNGDPSHKEEPT